MQFKWFYRHFTKTHVDDINLTQLIQFTCQVNAIVNVIQLYNFVQVVILHLTREKTCLAIKTKNGGRNEIDANVIYPVRLFSFSFFFHLILHGRISRKRARDVQGGRVFRYGVVWFTHLGNLPLSRIADQRYRISYWCINKIIKNQ